MTEKQNEALQKIITAIPVEYQDIYREIAEYAVSLGYMPLLKGAHGQYAVFSKPKINRTILKIVTSDPKAPDPFIEMRFFANIPPYSPFFQKAIDDRIYVWNFDCDHPCNNCGSCDGTQIYYSVYSDGTVRTLCGFTSLIYMPPVHAENVPEIKDALKKQDDYYRKWFNV